MTSYLSNKAFLDCLVGYRKRVRKWKRLGSVDLKPKIPDFIGECVFLICTKLGTRGNFSQYTYKDEMIGDAILNCITAIDNFDPRKSQNPYGYFSRIAWQAFVRYIEKESDQTYIKIKNYEYLHLLDQRGEIQPNDGETKVPATQVSTIFTDDFIRRFEETRERKKQRQKTRMKRPLRRKRRKKKFSGYDASLQRFFVE